MTQYILSNKEMAKADHLTIESGISSLDLMFNAGKKVFNNLPVQRGKRALFICGPGNNGGDGYVAADLILKQGMEIDIYCPISKAKESNDNLHYKQKLNKSLFVSKIRSLSNYCYVVDALFGTGLSRTMSDDLSSLVSKINQSKLDVFSVDIPSGINGDTSAVLGEAFKASDQIMPNIKKNDPSLWIKNFPFPVSSDHKYSRGMLVINTGPQFQTGAARLAGRSAMRVGAGAVTMACDEETAKILEPQISVELLSVIKEKNDFQKLLKDKRVSSVLIGPGNGVNDETKARTLMALAFVDHCVIDADAITCFENNPEELFIDTYPHTILTPHEGEFKRLFGEGIALMEDKVLKCVEAAKLAGSIVLLKGADTVIADPEGNVVINASEAPYLATAGSGDVLAGIIASLVGDNKMNAFDAACAGAYIHSKLGEMIGPGLIAEDLIDNIPLMIKKLHSYVEEN